MIYHCWYWPWSPELVVWFKHCKVTVHTLLFRREWLGSPALKEGRKRLGCTSLRGRYCMGSKYATPSMALWPMSGFELKAFEIQQMQKKSLPRASLISKTRNYREMRTAISSLSWGSFMAKKTGNGCQHRPAKATCTRLSHGVCHSRRPLLFPSVCHFSKDMFFFAPKSRFWLSFWVTHHWVSPVWTLFPCVNTLLFSFGNLSFFSLVCRVQVKKLRKLEKKKMFFLLYSFYINYLEFFGKKGLSLRLHLFILFLISVTGPDFILLPS